MKNRSELLFVVAVILFCFCLVGETLSEKKRVASVPQVTTALQTLPALDKMAENAKARITELAKKEKLLQAESDKWLEDIRVAFYHDQVDVANFKARLNDIERRKAGLKMAKENIAEDSLANAW